MNIPELLINQVREGRAVLFLGSGATKGAISPEGTIPPDGPQLANMLAERFLNASYMSFPLVAVSALSISQADLFTVQDFIRDIFTKFTPAPHHLLIPTFKWSGIVTTNYDEVLERAYDACTNAIQQLVPMLSNSDRVDDLLRRPNSVLFLKLHGCITCTHNSEIPLILTPEQYITHRKGRSRLFDLLKEWGYEYPIIFAGHSMDDFDIRQIILELNNELQEARPRYYLVKPEPDSIYIDMWANSRVTVLSGTFAEFLAELDRRIPRHLRANAQPVVRHPIQSKMQVMDDLEPSIREFLDIEAEYVHSGISLSQQSAQAFYRGFNKGWTAIVDEYDVRRKITDDILLDVFLAEEDDRPSVADFYVLRAEAGAGKTVCLQRVAWEASKDWEKICLYITPHGRLNYPAIKQISELISNRIFVFIDNAVEHVTEIQHFISRARREGIKVTVLTAERTNEWNMACADLDDYVSSVYELQYLDRYEIIELLSLLKANNSLGELEPLNQAERVKAFEQRAGRQLLVALHETTQGRPFEDILVDEYNQIRPLTAQSLYLTICFLNRLGVPVRAGLISRLHSIPMEEFKDQLFKPLEHVVQFREDPIINDMVFESRHQEIAQIVNDRILISPADRYNMLKKVLSALNLAYEADRRAFTQLIKGKYLLNMLRDHSMVTDIFNQAYGIARDDPHLLQQKAIYEMNRPNGNLNEAEKMLSMAREATDGDPSIVHSLAELARTRADKATVQIEKEHYRDVAAKLANTLTGVKRTSHAYHTLVKVEIDRLMDLVRSEKYSEEEINLSVQRVEETLEKALKAFSDDPYLLSSQADLSKVICDENRVVKSLEKALGVNRRNVLIALRLSKVYIAQDRPDKALKVLNDALEGNRANQTLNYEVARVLIASSPNSTQDILYHLKRSFSKGDENLEAQFWYARYLYVSGTSEHIREAADIFWSLRQARGSHDYRTRIRDVIKEGTAPKRYIGRIRKKDGNIGEVRRDGIGDDLFTHAQYLSREVWDILKIGDRVSFHIGFSLGGPKAIDIQIENRPIIHAVS